MKAAPECKITVGGGALFCDDLLKCSVCGHEKYPEVFQCPRGYDHTAPASAKTAEDRG